jgi:putative transposase
MLTRVSSKKSDIRCGALWPDQPMLSVCGILIQVLMELPRWWRLGLRSTRSLEAENLFLRRQFALYVERGAKRRRIDPAARILLSILSKFCDWRDSLVAVRPETMIRWHRAGWRLFWRLKSRPGRPPIPQQLQALIPRMANENPSWGERIAK